MSTLDTASAISVASTHDLSHQQGQGKGKEGAARQRCCQLQQSAYIGAQIGAELGG